MREKDFFNNKGDQYTKTLTSKANLPREQHFPQ